MPRDYKYWTYIMASKSGTLYIGMTHSLERRVQHTKTERTKASQASTTATGWSIGRVSTTSERQLTGRKN